MTDATMAICHGYGTSEEQRLERESAMAIRTIDYLKRLTSSTNGNPRFRVHFTDGSSAITMSDAGFCYGIENKEYRDVPLEVTFTKAGRISHIAPVVLHLCDDECGDSTHPQDGQIVSE